MRILLVVLGLFLFTPVVRAADAPKKDKELEEHVNKALGFLKNTQNEDGTWSAGQGGQRNAALTGLCVMAFLSAGHVPGEGPYAETVEKGIRAVLKMQQANGLIASEGGHEMYHHGICTLMLAEVAGMTEGPLAKEVREKLEKAVTLTLKAQRKETRRPADVGGWRYQVNGVDADMSVTGWQIMSLRAAKNLGCDVPPDAIENAVKYVKRCYTPMNDGARRSARIAIRRAMAASRSPAPAPPSWRWNCAAARSSTVRRKSSRGPVTSSSIRRAGTSAVKCSPIRCTIARKRHSNSAASTGMPTALHMHKVLFSNQGNTGGWYGPEATGRAYGPNYTTSMAVLALTVEYRYLPIYQRGEEPTDKDK